MDKEGRDGRDGDRRKTMTRAADGKPDLSGLWNRISPKYSRNVAADLKPGEVLPWAQTLVDERRKNLGKGYMNTICVPFGPSYVTSADTTGAEQMKSSRRHRSS